MGGKGPFPGSRNHPNRSHHPSQQLPPLGGLILWQQVWADGPLTSTLGSVPPAVLFWLMFLLPSPLAMSGNYAVPNRISRCPLTEVKPHAGCLWDGRNQWGGRLPQACGCQAQLCATSRHALQIHPPASHPLQHPPSGQPLSPPHRHCLQSDYWGSGTGERQREQVFMPGLQSRFRPPK